MQNISLATFQTPGAIGIIFLIAAVLVLLGWIIHLEMRISRLLRGNPEKNLEAMIRSISEHYEKEGTFRSDLEKYLEGVEKRLRRSLQGSEVIRFHPFKGDGSGGNQSFSIAATSEEGDGFVITGLHSRERVSVYSKPVTQFASSYELTDEEQDAVAKLKIALSGGKK